MPGECAKTNRARALVDPRYVIARYAGEVGKKKSVFGWGRIAGAENV
jgi:hypothetical protein